MMLRENQELLDPQTGHLRIVGTPKQTTISTVIKLLITVSQESAKRISLTPMRYVGTCGYTGTHINPAEGVKCSAGKAKH